MSTTPNAALVARIRDQLVEFNWSNYGLDLIDDAETEWADALADQLAAEIVRPHPGYGTGCTCPCLGEGTPEHAPGALCPPPDGPINEVDDSLSEDGHVVYAPCQPIGCDAGIHLAGCVYAEADVAPNAGSAS